MSTNNQQVAHAWAHGAAAKGGNLKSDGVSLTSYYTTIAAIIDGVYYISANTMSPSTGRHISYARQAVPGEWPNPNVFFTTAFSWSGSNPALTHEAMILPAARSAVSHLEYELGRAKTKKKTKLDAIAAYIQERERIVAHAARFNVQVIMPEMVLSDDAINQYQEQKRIAEEKKEAARIKAQKKQQKEDKKQFNIWLTTGAGRCPSSFIERGNDFITIKSTLAPRADNQQDYDMSAHIYTVSTSQGAECPLEHAVKALRFYKSLELGDKAPFVYQPYHTNGHKIPLGHFTLESIDEAGTVKAGCHTFTAKEISRFIAQWREVLGL